MPEHIHFDDSDLVNPDTHHEKSDVNVRALIWFVVIFVIFAIVSHFVLLGTYKALVKIENSRQERPATAIARPADASVPKNQPLLQPFPRKDAKGEVLPPQRNTERTDLAEMRRAEERYLTTYGWVDRQHGTARVPIDVAKRMLIRRGLPLQPRIVTPPQSVPPPAEDGVRMQPARTQPTRTQAPVQTQPSAGARP